MGKLQDMYGRVCGQWQVKSEGGQSEFVGLCQVLESRGLVAVKRAKEMRMNKVCVSGVCVCVCLCVCVCVLWCQ